MRKLIETTHVSLGGEVGSIQDWVFPYLDEEHKAYTARSSVKRTVSCLGV